jgi:hypothetical protein
VGYSATRCESRRLGDTRGQYRAVMSAWAQSLDRLGGAVARYVRRAPGTHIYLLVLFVTTATVHSTSPELANQLLRQVSTNLTQMGQSAGRVLFLSAFILSGESPVGWVFEALLLCAVYVPLERWVGTARWLLVVVAGHVGATLVTTLGIWADVRHNPGGASLTRAVDVGVSYGRMAAAGFLVFALRPPWWRALMVAAVAALTVPALVTGHTYTDVGHAAAALLGASLWMVLGPGVARRPPLRLPLRTRLPLRIAPKIGFWCWSALVLLSSPWSCWRRPLVASRGSASVRPLTRRRCRAG